MSRSIADKAYFVKETIQGKEGKEYSFGTNRFLSVNSAGFNKLVNSGQVELVKGVIPAGKYKGQQGLLLVHKTDFLNMADEAAFSGKAMRPKGMPTKKSAFMLFSMDIRAQQKLKNAEHFVRNQQDLPPLRSADIGEMWYSLSDSEKEKYEQFAREEKVKYEREMAQWVSAGNIRPSRMTAARRGEGRLSATQMARQAGIKKPASVPIKFAAHPEVSAYVNKAIKKDNGKNPSAAEKAKYIAANKSMFSTGRWGQIRAQLQREYDQLSASYKATVQQIGGQMTSARLSSRPLNYYQKFIQEETRRLKSQGAQGNVLVQAVANYNRYKMTPQGRQEIEAAKAETRENARLRAQEKPAPTRRSTSGYVPTRVSQRGSGKYGSYIQVPSAETNTRISALQNQLASIQQNVGAMRPTVSPTRVSPIRTTPKKDGSPAVSASTQALIDSIMAQQTQSAVGRPRPVRR
jgi:hypothetical protein